MDPCNSDSNVIAITTEILDHWKAHPPEADAFQRQRSAAQRNESSLQTPTLTLTWPRLPMWLLHQWLGQRVLLWPTGIEQRRRVAIVSSRRKQRRDLQTWWFDALRTAVLRTDFRDDCLCVADGTASAAAVTRASELFGIQRLKFHVCPGILETPEQLADWLDHTVSQWTDICLTPFETSVILSPRYVDSSSAADARSQLDSQPSVMTAPDNQDRLKTDAALVLAGEKLVSLYCRSAGNIEALLQQRLTDDVTRKSILLAVSIPPASRPPATMLQQGAIEWRLQMPDSSASMDSAFHTSANCEAATSEQHGLRTEDLTGHGSTEHQLTATSELPVNNALTAGPLQVSEEWLCHWTRPASGAWPGQSADEFLDELILGCATADRSALARLLRILAEGCIRAALNRKHEPPTVSFTAVPLAEFRSRRIFRSHRQRYDFEPWGVAVRRATLQRLGAEPVRYLEPGDIADKAAVDANTATTFTFTQPRWDTKRRMDWSLECEWRIAGDLPLNSVPTSDLCLFVNDSAAARVIAQASAWPVVIVPEANHA